MPNPITADCLADLAGIRHGFFTREGGVSQGIYAGLNCGAGSKDDRAHVMENRARVAAHLGAAPGSLLTCYQIHSASAVIVTKPWVTKPWVTEPWVTKPWVTEPWTLETMPKGDALVTNVPGLAIGALAADCAPILFADPQAKVIAAAHAGWKGALNGILESTITTMASIGAKRNRIRAALGPCIGPAAYEVGPEFEENFLKVNPDYARFFRRASLDARPYFDLPAFVLERLAAAGLDTVENCSQCTYSDESRLYSYRRTTHRREPDYGRQVSAIVLL